MKIYIVTDIEGVAGITNWQDYGRPDRMYYELGKELTTREINAACDGFFAAGATEIVVDDAHGRGGINQLMLDPRALYLRRTPPSLNVRRLLDETYDALAFVGQHAKAGTRYAHIAHTMSWEVLDTTINGISVGEFGMRALTASEFGVPTVFLSGDRAACREAEELFPGIVTAEVKRGLNPESGDEYGPETYSKFNEAGIHLHPERARALIRAKAEEALVRLKKEPFGIVRLDPPYTYECKTRATDKHPPRVTKRTHPTSIIKLLESV